MKSGKSLTTILDNLESCGFIRKYVLIHFLAPFFVCFYFATLR